jgi:hypothetical protein
MVSRNSKLFRWKQLIDGLKYHKPSYLQQVRWYW